jgi:hypothetical protein
MGSFIKVENLKVGINFEHRYKGQIESWPLKPKNWEKASRLNVKLGINILEQFLYGFYRSCQYIVSFSNSLLSSTLGSKAYLISPLRKCEATCYFRLKVVEARVILTILIVPTYDLS